MSNQERQTMILDRIKGLLAAPVFEDEDKTRIAGLLNTILLAALALTMISFILSSLTLPVQVPGLVIEGILVLIELGMLFLMRRGRVQLTSVLLSSTLWVSVTLLSFVYGGLRGSGPPLYITVTFIAGFLLGGRAGLTFGGLSAVAALAMLYGDVRGVLPSPLSPITLTDTWITLTVNLLMIAVLLHLATRSANDALACSRRNERKLLAEVAERKRMEEVLRESEEKYRNLVERANDGIVIIQDGIVIKYANPRLAEMWGGSVEEVVGTPFTDYVCPDELPKMVDQYKRRMAGEDIAPIYETVLRSKDGSRVYVELNAGVITYQGQPADLVIVRDITERKRAAEALRESEERYRTILENIEDGYYEVDVAGNFTFFNDALCRIFGYPADELMGMNNRQYMEAEAAKRAYRAFKEVYLTGKPARVFDHEIIKKDGTRRTLEASVSLMSDPTGKPVGLRGITRDVTERKRVEEALELRVKQLAALSQASQAVTASLELDQVLDEIVSLASKAVASDFTSVMLVDETGHPGQSADTMLDAPTIERRIRDKGFTSWIVHSHKALIVDEIGEDGAIPPGLDEGVPHTANPHLVEAGVKSLAGLPLEVKGRLLGVLYLHSLRPGAFQDQLPLMTAFANQAAIAIENARLHEQARREIAERKQAEAELKIYAAKLERSNRELESFAYMASHDLQEPLRKVQAFGDRLKAKYGGVLGDQGLDYLERMQNAGVRMQTLINDLLTYSRVTTKAQPFVSVDLAQVVRGVLSDLETRIEQVGGRVEVGDLPAIEADPTQMRQLLQNLIGNALKFHREGETPVVKIHAETLNGRGEGAVGVCPGDGLCQIVVEDNGIGFDEKYVERIFQVFQRLHGRSEYEGTGIGLATCRKIVERHGGSITAKSAPGQGATFIVTLPVRQFVRENS
jgi:PAS domain S-box-containing protein